MATITVSFILDSEKDKRLVRWLDGLPKRGKSEAIRKALAAHLGQNGITSRDILNEIQEVKRLIQGGVAVTVAEETETPQDPELSNAMTNLSKLGL